MLTTIVNCNENGRKVSKQVENTEGKGEIACYEQFLHLPQCFQKSCTADMLKPGFVWERVKDLIGPELSKLFVLEFAKITESDFIYNLASTNVDQLVPNTVIIYMTMRSWTSSIMGQIQHLYLELFALESGKIV